MTTQTNIKNHINNETSKMFYVLFGTLAYIISINLKQKKKILAIHALTLRCSSWKGCSGNSGNGTFLFSTSENNFTTRLVKSSKDSTRKQTTETELKLIITPSG